jgi:uncharacterized protein (TIGR03083 family)
LVERLDALTDAERASFQFPLGPMTVDYGAYLRLRINEHVLHAWDVAVAFDPSAALAPDAVGTVLEALPMIARFTGRPTTGSPRALRVRTTAPDRRFVVDLRADGVSVGPDDGSGPADLALPAEAFVRLVYGRLDRGHTPPFDGDGTHLDALRRVFPGV